MTGMSGLPASRASCTCACWRRDSSLFLSSFERETRLVVIGLGNGVGAHERRVAIIGRLIERDLRLLRSDVAQHAPVVLLHRVDGQRNLREVGLGAVESDLELPGIEAVQNLASLDVLVLRDVDLLDDAGDVGRDADLVGFDIRIVRRHHLAAGDVPVGAGDQRQRQQRKQRPA